MLEEKWISLAPPIPYKATYYLGLVRRRNMIVNGRLGSDGEFVAKLMDRNRGIRVDHTGVPAFWLEVLFKPEELATKVVYLVEKQVEYESNKVLAVYRRKGEAKRFAFLQEGRLWRMSADLVGDECFKLIDDDISIVIRKIKIG